MKKIIAIILVLLICASLVSCGTFEGSENYSKHTEMVTIYGRQNLYYDPNTMIVYIIFNECTGYAGYGYMSPYYAPNGLPYLYDAANQALVEIE